MIEKAEKAFELYTKNYDMSVKEINYKYRHSYRVEKLMEELAIKFGFDEKRIFIAKLIGLLHDIGRFEQIRRYKEVNDAKTGLDHADLSCVYLFDDNHIRDFIDDDSYDEIIKDAIKNHNKYEIDPEVKNDNLLFSKMIRDIDKVDIYRVLSEEYTQVFDKNDIRDEVYEAFHNRKTIKRLNDETKSEQCLVHTLLVYDINFKESFQMLDKLKYLDDYFKTVKPKEDSVDKFNEIKDDIYKFIEKNKQ